MREWPPLHSEWREIRGLRLHGIASTHVHDATTAPVVLVHGFGMSSGYFVPTAQRLAACFDVYAPDLPGHGRSDTPAHVYDIRALADVLIEWMDAMGLERASLIGNSMGCQIAVEAALQHPGRVERLVLIGPTLDPAARNLVRLFTRVLRDGLHEPVTLMYQIVRDYLRMGVRLLQEFRFMLSDPIERKLASIDHPTLLVRGEHDAIASRDWLQRAASLIGARARVIELTGAAHAANYSAADILVEAIAGFLREAPGRMAQA